MSAVRFMMCPPLRGAGPARGSGLQRGTPKQGYCLQLGAAWGPSSRTRPPGALWNYTQLQLPINAPSCTGTRYNGSRESGLTGDNYA